MRVYLWLLLNKSTKQESVWYRVGIYLNPNVNVQVSFSRRVSQVSNKRCYMLKKMGQIVKEISIADSYCKF